MRAAQPCEARREDEGEEKDGGGTTVEKRRTTAGSDLGDSLDPVRPLSALVATDGAEGLTFLAGKAQISRGQTGSLEEGFRAGPERRGWGGQ